MSSSNFVHLAVVKKSSISLSMSLSDLDEVLRLPLTVYVSSRKRLRLKQLSIKRSFAFSGIQRSFLRVLST